MLKACPFCRALFTSEEGEQCPECEVGLVSIQKLGPSEDASLLDERPSVPPEDQPLAWNAWGRGRGLLLLLGILGLGLFFAPWLEIQIPESDVRSGFDLARGRAGWLWGGAAAYLVLVPLVGSRRTVSGMRGVRAIAVLLGSMTLVEVVMLFLLTPTRQGPLPFRVDWRWGMAASGVVSALTALVALRFGGSVPARPAHPEKVAEPQNPHGRILH